MAEKSRKIMNEPLNIKRAVAADFKAGQRVDYVHFDGTAERGTVSSVNAKYVFVRFDKHTAKFGWDGATSQSCDPNDLHTVEKT